MYSTKLQDATEDTSHFLQKKQTGDTSHYFKAIQLK